MAACSEEALRAGRISKVPVGYRELDCATLAFCDEKGQLLSSIRFGQAPEAKMVSPKLTLRKDLFHTSEYLASAVAPVYGDGHPEGAPRLLGKGVNAPRQNEVYTPWSPRGLV